MKMRQKVNFFTEAPLKMAVCSQMLIGRFGRVLKDQRGQGTTEYAILVGVLVVIAIIAVVAFSGKLKDLWDAITSNMKTIVIPKSA